MGRGTGLGCGGILLIVVIAFLTGQDPLQLLDMVGSSGVTTQVSPADTTPGQAPQDELGQFASVVLADTEETWTRLFQENGESYRLPRLVLFTQSVASACGFQSSAVGPFYCPGDQKVYIDLGFFRQLDQRFGAPGDFAQAYVIAHEVGHHVQNLLGVSAEIQRQQRSVSRSEANQLSVRVELQADCLAGVWAHHANRQRQLLEPGDVEEGLRAAAVIGDDMMQRRATGSVQPESWTHGSSAQRQRWLRIGLETGDPDRCDTFATSSL